MLLGLSLTDYVIVARAEVEFGAGFNVLSGETGAGKSILIDALALALGGRADASVVRADCARADIVASFDTDQSIEQWLAEHEFGGDPGTVLLRRVIDADGRSRGFINGHPSTASLLRELGGKLVDVHGQHENQSLTKTDAQRALLDAAGEHTALAGQTAQAWSELSGLARRVEHSETQSRELALERERVQWQVQELGALKLADGEWAQLGVEQKRLANAAGLIESAHAVSQACADGDDNLLDRLRAVEQRVRQIAALDESVRPSVELIESAVIQLGEVAAAIGDYAERIDLDPQRLEQVERRMAAIHATARKFKLNAEQIPAELTQLIARLAQLDAAQDSAALRQALEQARQRYRALAKRLSAARRKTAARLEKSVSELLGKLGMSGARLQIVFESIDGSAGGDERIEFHIAGRGAGVARPLAKVASGGELSRISLAIAVTAAEGNPVPTLIFDEADAGVGGATAELIGQLMRRLGQSRQVLCVTHLPQVAALANRHFKVSKSSDKEAALSQIEPLAAAARVEEIARMLGGVAITATTRRHARELLGSS